MSPSVGRIVHFWRATASEPRAALITHVVNRVDFPKDECDWRVVLRVFGPTGGDEVVLDAKFSSVPSPDHWTWPPRVA